MISSGANHPAAQVVMDADHGGYSDWFLPSVEELNLMYENLHLEGLGDFLLEAYTSYWSSSEDQTLWAWMQTRTTGSQMNGISKTTELGVRAARSFTADEM